MRADLDFPTGRQRSRVDLRRHKAWSILPPRGPGDPAAPVSALPCRTEGPAGAAIEMTTAHASSFLRDPISASIPRRPAGFHRPAATTPYPMVAAL